MSRERPAWGGWRGALAGVICAAGCVGFAFALDDHYAIGEWLFWRIGLLWLYLAVFTTACVGAGLWMLRRVFDIDDLGLLESCLFAMAVGQAGFVVALYALGAVGLFHTPVAIALPIAFLFLGRDDLRNFLGDTIAHLGEPRRATPVTDLIVKVATVWAILGLAVLYLIGFTPDTISLDAAWYHLPVAQDYVRAGGLVAFPSEYNRAFPHLNSMLCTWGFLLPGMSHPFDWMLALHFDFSMIVWKAVGVGVGAQVLLGDRRPRALWTGFFLFPMVFTFANAVTAGPEHTSGFWTIPLFVATLRMLRDFDLRWCALLGVCAGGAILSRYQSVYMIAACGSVIAARWCWVLAAELRGRRRVDRRKLWRAPLLVIGVGLAVSSPHFIKNLVFYGDPIYPFLVGKVASAHPTHPEAVAFFKETLGNPGNRPKFAGSERLTAAFELFFSFSFRPHHVVVKQDWPIFGSLFTLLMPCVLLVKDNRRIWIGIWCCFVVILVWCNLYLQTRYLNTASTIFAAVAVALMVKVWDLGRVARIGLVPLVLLQAIWGLDAATYSGHEPLKATIDLARSGWAGKLDPKQRYPYWRGFAAVTEATPPDAQILVRGPRSLLGLDRFAHRDVQSQQGNFYYAPLRNAGDVWRHYRERGITHVLYKRNADYAGTLQSSVVFADLVRRQGMAVQNFGAWDLVELAPEAPEGDAPVTVGVIGLAQPYPNGIYDADQLSKRGTPRPGSGHSLGERAVTPRRRLTGRELVTAALACDVIVVGRATNETVAKIDAAGFVPATEIDDVTVYVRK